MNRYVVAAALGLLLMSSVAVAQEASSTQESASDDGWEVSAEAAEEVELEAPKSKPKRKAKKGKKTGSSTVVVGAGQQQAVKVPPGQTVVVVNQASVPPPPPPPPPPPTTRKGFHEHDGFYFRGGFDLGALILIDSEDDDKKEGGTIAGFAGGFNLGLGGTIANGFVLGGRLQLTSAPGPVLYTEDKAYALDGGMSMVSLQLFGDWYLDPKKGLHVEAAIGPASYSYDPTPESDGNGNYRTDDSETVAGVAGALGVGYEWWVGDDWSLGIVARLGWGFFPGRFGTRNSLARISYDRSEGVATYLGPSVGFTFTYH